MRLEVPRDRNSTFEPQVVRKRQRRLTGVEDMVRSLVAKGLTTGELSAHLAEVYINNTVVPMLCRKAGVPAADVRGTSPAAGPAPRVGQQRGQDARPPRAM